MKNISSDFSNVIKMAKPLPVKNNVKLSFADQRRAYGLPDSISSKQNLRWRQPIEKGFAWYWFSRYIRERDVKMWGRCISCDKEITFSTSDCGHFAPAANCGIELLMDELNNNAECGGCNGFDEGHLFGYEVNLRKRYGDQKVDELKAKYLIAKFKASPSKSPQEWGAVAIEYKAKYEALV